MENPFIKTPRTDGQNDCFRLRSSLLTKNLPAKQKSLKQETVNPRRIPKENLPKNSGLPSD